MEKNDDHDGEEMQDRLSEIKQYGNIFFHVAFKTTNSANRFFFFFSLFCGLTGCDYTVCVWRGIRIMRFNSMAEKNTTNKENENKHRKKINAETPFCELPTRGSLSS